MSNPQFHWDSSARQWMKYDHYSRRWVYYESIPQSVNADAEQEGAEQAPDNEEEPRSLPEDAGSAFTEHQRQLTYGSEHVSSPNYRFAPSSDVDELSQALSRQHLDEGGPSQKSTRAQGINYGTLLREPKESVTDPKLFARGVGAHGRIQATEGEKEKLDANFRIQRDPVNFFIPGRVFRILWPENPGQVSSNMTVITDGKFINEAIVTKIRWFVVVKAGSNFCSCLPISTYSRRGCGKPGLKKWQHSIIFTGRSVPPLLPQEAAAEGEAGMMRPIAVDPSIRGSKIHPASRIDYSRLYTIEHYVKVQDFGMVQQPYIKIFRKQWWFVLERDMLGELDPTVEEADNEDDQDEELDQNQNSASAYREWVTAFTAFEQDNMMTLASGDRIGVTDYVNEHWWTGLNTRTNVTALFPVSYVRRDA